MAPTNPAPLTAEGLAAITCPVARARTLRGEVRHKGTLPSWATAAYRTALTEARRGDCTCAEYCAQLPTGHGRIVAIGELVGITGSRVSRLTREVRTT